MIEAEIKARLADPDTVRRRLDQWADGVAETYSDTYFDSPDEKLTAGERELRVRTIDGPAGARHLLTYKGRPVDTATQSKPEFEVSVSDPQAAAAILTGLGFPSDLSFTKKCVNYRVLRGDREFLATVVTVPEVSGTFLEVETLAAEDETDRALEAVRGLMAELGLGSDDFTTEAYTAAVRAAQAA